LAIVKKQKTKQNKTNKKQNKKTKKGIKTKILSHRHEEPEPAALLTSAAHIWLCKLKPGGSWAENKGTLSVFIPNLPMTDIITTVRKYFV
jgi:hypothetical protein